MPRGPSSYEEATYASPWWLIRYPHQKRIATSIELLMAQKPSIVLDWGAGSGEFLARLLADGRAEDLEKAIAYDPREELTGRRLTKRFAEEPRVAVADSRAAIGKELGGRAVEAVTCMGVLEHLPQRERLDFYRWCAEAVRPGGRVVIDVPVEIGPSLLIKQFGRRVLKRRPHEYPYGELLGAILGVRQTDPSRSEPDQGPDYIPSHRGFDHRVLRDELERFQVIKQVVPTPIRWLPSWLCNQEVFYVSEPLGQAGRGAASGVVGGDVPVEPFEVG